MDNSSYLTERLDPEQQRRYRIWASITPGLPPEGYPYMPQWWPNPGFEAKDK